MEIIKENQRTLYLYDTPVENLFISEYMPDMPGDYVKVYLYLLMKYSLGEAFSIEPMERNLRLEAGQGEEAIAYLKESGILVETPERIELGVLKERLYGHGESGSSSREKGEGEGLYDPEIKDMIGQIEKITGRYASGGEMKALLSWIEQDRMAPKIIVKAYEYCKKRGKDNYKYIGKVLYTWQKKGLFTLSQVDAFLEDSDERYYTYRRIAQALGFQRGLTEREREVIDRWLDHHGFSLEEILKACGKTAGITNPNINYVNAVLTGKKDKKTKSATKNQIKEFYQARKQDREEQAQQRREKLYQELPELAQIDGALNRCNIDLTRALIGGGKNKAREIQAIKKTVAELEQKRDRLLTKNNYPVDITTVKYHCALCQDTGLTKDGQQCSCYKTVKKAMEEAADG